MMHCFLYILATLFLTISVGSAHGEAPSPHPQATEFFEKQVRPLLVEHCLECHGATKQENGLRLDSAAGLKKGGQYGPVVVAGDPLTSKLIEAVRRTGTLKMPPKGILSNQAIDVLSAWVKMGAPWPEATPQLEANAAKTHWAFQPVRKPAVPSIKNGEWVTSPIDAFILSRLEAVGLSPSPVVDRRTLIRRVTFDLHGLPPTQAEIEEFVRESTTHPRAAYEKLIDRLLASPRYGERWGRHWLDVARYADTKGYVRLNDNPRYVTAWTYRDYVIRAFNEDLPYDQFILQQLAADRLPMGNDQRSLAALGFLTLGQRFLNSQHDIIDDRIDVTTRGLLGLTVSCARCHDHKFDPIPTRDYYSLHGVFASSIEPRVPPLIALPGEHAKYMNYLKELTARTARFDEYLRGQQSRLSASFRTKAGDYLLAAQKEQVQANFLAVMFLVDSTKELNPVMLQRWGEFLQQTRNRPHPILTPWHALARLKPEEFAAHAPAVIANSARSNSLVIEALTKTPPRTLEETAQRYGDLFRAADERWQQLLKKEPKADRLPEPAWEEIRRLLYGPEALTEVAFGDVEEFLFVDVSTQSQFHGQQRQVEDWIASPGAAPHALVLNDVTMPRDSKVLIRGNSSNPGESVPRQFLEAITSGKRKPFTDGSGRLELAQAIADRNNPLTARVFVNRVWLHQFGEGIVRTPGDFGLRGEAPTNPELLDYLAARFVEEGWSIKKLHRWLLLSSVYQQQSLDDPKAAAKDPENRLWWKMNRRRLDWESLRDSLLAVSGELDTTLGGPSLEMTAPPFSKRRSVYGYIDRLNLPGVFRTFDFASPDASTPQRHLTTGPQQALFLMNNPFVKTQANRLAARTDLMKEPMLENRIDRLHWLLFGRAAQPEEITLGLKFLAGTSTAWERYVQALLLVNEFAFVD